MSWISAMTARRVTIVLGALATIALLAPVGARAAGQFVTIVGAGDVAAEVEGGHLLVSNSDKSPLTVRALDTVPVKGGVSTYPQPGPLHVQGRRDLGDRDRVGAFGPSRHFSYADRVAITSFTLSSWVEYFEVAVYALAGSNCDTLNFQNARKIVYLFNDVRSGTVHVAFPEPLIVGSPSPGTQSPWCIILAPSGAEEGVTANGLDFLTIGHVLPSD